MAILMPAWNSIKGAKNSEHYVNLICFTCGKNFSVLRGLYNGTIKRYPGQDRFFCSLSCTYKGRRGHPVTPETVEKIRSKQLGISVLTRGKKGHRLSEETKEKIRLAKLGKPAPVDTKIILDELAFRGQKEYFAMVGLIPDAVFIQDGKLVALEVEKERWETGIRRKMAAYDNRPEYQKVILVWYSPTGERLKEWHKDNGEWKVVT